MSRRNPSQSHRQHYLLECTSFQGATSSTWSRHSRIYSSTSLSSHDYSQLDTDLLDPLDDIALDNIDQRTASSATLLSCYPSSSPSINQLLSDTNCTSSESDPFPQRSGSQQSRFLYPLHEPGQRTAQRTQRLRTRTAAVIKSIPATCKDVIDDHAGPKLRRISGVRDLRRAFRDADPKPVHAVSPSEVSNASYELGILATARPLSSLSPRSSSSLRTLVDVGITLLPNSGDVKTLSESIQGSISISSRLSTKIQSTLSLSRTSRVFLPTDSSQSILPKKHHVHNLLTTPSRRHTSLQLDNPLSRSPGETVWSCAKISQSATKRAARRGHAPRRVFSHPIAAVAS